MSYLYILAEGNRDEAFYDLLVERVSGRRFDRPETDLRLRHGSNWSKALTAARLLMNRVQHWTSSQEVFVVLAVDNDRAPGHPGAEANERPFSKRDRSQASRYAALENLRALGGPAVRTALAVPVEMIESWVLVLLDPDRPPLPPFARAEQWSARQYYGSKPPPQLKDLRRREAEARGCSDDELFWQAAEADWGRAAAVSRSLAMFIEELKAWRHPA